MPASTQAIWGQLRSLSQQPTPTWTTEITQLISRLPTSEQDAAASYIIKARDLPSAWGRWELELQSVFELFLDAPLESFNRDHRYHLYIKADESAYLQVVEHMGVDLNAEQVEMPTLAELTTHVLKTGTLQGDHPSAGYPLLDRGHLAFDQYDRFDKTTRQHLRLGHAQSNLFALDKLCDNEGETPFFYTDDDGRCWWWPSLSVLWRCQADGTLFDALYQAFRMENFVAPDHIAYPLCTSAQYTTETIPLLASYDDISYWPHDITNEALRAHLGQVLGEAAGPWEERGHHISAELGFGYPMGNAGCALRVSGHCSQRWPSECGSDGDGLADFAYDGGLEILTNYVKGVVSWVYTQHGNAQYGGMCIVEASPGFDDEIQGRREEVLT